MAARRTPAALLTLLLLTLMLTPPLATAQPPQPRAFSGRIMDLAKQVDTRCREETGADRESLQHYIHGILDDHESFKCYIKCLMVQFEALSHDGVFAVEGELQNVPPEIVEEGHRIVLACQDTKGTTPCDTAYQLHRCYNSTNPELYKEVLMAFDLKIEE